LRKLLEKLLVTVPCIISCHRLRRGIRCRSSVCVFCLSVCPSVCHTRHLWQNQTMHCWYFNHTL